MARKYTVKLTDEERTQLQAVAKGRQGKMAIAAWKVTHAKALLQCRTAANSARHGPTNKMRTRWESPKGR